VHGGKERIRVTEDLPSGGGIGEGRCQHPPGIRKRRHASISPANLHRRNDRLLTLATPEDKDFAAAQGRRSPSAEGLMAVESSPSNWLGLRLRTLAESLTALRPLPVSQQADLGAGSNGEGSDLAPSLGPSNRVQGPRKRLSSDCEPSLPDRTHSRAPGLRRKTPRDAASKEAKRGALGAKGHLMHPRRGNQTFGHQLAVHGLMRSGSCSARLIHPCSRIALRGHLPLACPSGPMSTPNA